MNKPDWSQIDTVLLDMDGTLLDLHYDNHFWLEYLPERYAEHFQLPQEEARDILNQEYEKVHGTISWYCLDYWADTLKLPITEMKREVQHLISMREDVPPFLSALKQSGRQVALVTNAHPGSLSLKLEQTALGSYLDTMISVHEYGVSKESPELWRHVHQRLKFDPARTLFIDDSLRILTVAQKFGIKWLSAVLQPDSKKPNVDTDPFFAVDDYRCFIDDILKYQA